MKGKNKALEMSFHPSLIRSLKDRLYRNSNPLVKAGHWQIQSGNRPLLYKIQTKVTECLGEEKAYQDTFSLHRGINVDAKGKCFAPTPFDVLNNPRLETTMVEATG